MFLKVQVYQKNIQIGYGKSKTLVPFKLRVPLLFGRKLPLVNSYENSKILIVITSSIVPGVYI